MSTRISIDCTRPLVMSEDEAKEKITEIIGLNKSAEQDIRAKIDNYGSPLSHKQTGRPLKINERTERHLKRIIREDPFTFYKEINMELAKPDVFYRAAHKPRLTARHRKSRLHWAKEHINWIKDQWRNVVWSDESRFCMKYSKRVSAVKWDGGGAMAWVVFGGEVLDL
ncbi:hypothetical protein G6F43_011340 [Rhizopus delemar]|nr:hypothetical protein G6F43_011340 [Rhizopus delemar]